MPNDEPTIDRFKSLLGRLMRVSKDEVLRKERQEKAKRQRTPVRAPPRRKAG
jgi:hypothetical protein